MFFKLENKKLGKTMVAALMSEMPVSLPREISLFLFYVKYSCLFFVSKFLIYFLCEISFVFLCLFSLPLLHVNYPCLISMSHFPVSLTYYIFMFPCLSKSLYLFSMLYPPVSFPCQISLSLVLLLRLSTGKYSHSHIHLCNSKIIVSLTDFSCKSWRRQ